MLRWMLMVATLGVAMVPADARLAAGLIDHDKLRRFVPSSLGLLCESCACVVVLMAWALPGAALYRA